MKKFLASIALFLSFGAIAGPSVEMGIGYAQAQAVDDGGWYQEKFPHQLNLKTTTWFIGVTDDINDNLRWHVNYVNLGKYSSDAIATTDADYNAASPTGCNNTPCVAQTRFVGSGTTNGVKATLEYHTKGEIQYGVSAGLYAFKPVWNETLYNWTDSLDRPVVPGPLYHSVQNKVTFRPTIGFGVRNGNFETRIDWYNTQTYGAADITLMKNVTTISVVYHF